jgi:hypothetical protein
MKYVLFILTLSASSLLIAEENPLVGKQELFISQINMGSNSLTWTLKAQSTIWGYDRYITTYYDSSSISITGNRWELDGWSFGTAGEGIPLFAYSLYKLGFDSNHYIFIDFRDSYYFGGHYSTYSTTPDVVIRYDGSTQSLAWKDKDITPDEWHSVAVGNTLTIWEMKNQGSPTTADFQPTSPTNLTVTNESGHPRLNWTASTPDSVRYYVYRGNNQIAFTSLATTTYLDEEVRAGSGATIYYKVRAISADGTKPSPDFSNTASIEGRFESEKKMPNITLKEKEIETKFSAYPNPFNPATTISVQTKEDGHLSVAVFNVYGQQVAELAKGYYAAGTYQFAWDAGHATNGVYICRLMTRNKTQTTKLILMK